MSSPPVATLAPESDAMEDGRPLPAPPSPPPKTTAPAPAPAPAPAAPPSSSSAAPHPTLSDHCTSDRPTPSGETPAGELRKLNNIDVYVTKPPSYPHSPARLLLLLTGGTGLLSANNQLQADHFARAGYLVVMPDLFRGDPAPNPSAASASELAAAEAEAAASGSFLDRFKVKALETAKSFLIDMWLARHTQERVMPVLKGVLEGAGEEFADAVRFGGGVYAVGYCFGARYVLLLAREGQGKGTGKGDEEAGVEAPLIKAGALAHATLVSKDDFVGLRAPLSVVCVEDDPMFPDEVRIAGEEYMSANGVEHEVQVYPGVPHGFAVVGDYSDEHIKTAQATAYDQMLKWIEEH